MYKTASARKLFENFPRHFLLKILRRKIPKAVPAVSFVFHMSDDKNRVDTMDTVN